MSCSVPASSGASCVTCSTRSACLEPINNSLNRPDWPADAAVGKTVVSSGMIDRVVSKLGRRLLEVPVGFKWFAPALFDGSCCFGGEESAGASFLRRDGSVWTTDKDGPIMNLLAAEITARTGRDPGERYAALTAEFGPAYYTRIDAPATPEQKAKLARLSPESVKTASLAGEPILRKLTHAPGNNASIGGLKVVTSGGWFAARPSGTEAVCKVYAESFRDERHLQMLVQRCAADRAGHLTVQWCACDGTGGQERHRHAAYFLVRSSLLGRRFLRALV